MISGRRRYFLVLVWVLIQVGGVTAEVIGEDETAFLKEHAPELLGIVREAEREEHREVLEEVLERIPDFLQEFKEVREEEGAAWAKLALAEMDIEAGLEYLVFKFEEDLI